MLSAYGLFIKEMAIMLGHHHISMITKNAKKNNAFYTNVLGLRRVLVTVNQDSPNMYHLFYGDKVSAPGTELTFFEIPMAGRTQRGTNTITQIGLLVPSYQSLQYWEQRLAERGVQTDGIGIYAGRAAIQFEDPEGLRLALINNKNEPLPEQWVAWDGGDVEIEHRILGMGPIELTVREPQKTIYFVEKLFNYKVIEEKGKMTRLQTEGGTYSELVIVQQDGPAERPGRGSIHHLALRAQNDAQLRAWLEQLNELGYTTSGEVDRHYFRSVYVRDDNNILFEIATDEPGFLAFMDEADLGKELILPPKLEAHREEIVASLEPLE